MHVGTVCYSLVDVILLHFGDSAAAAAAGKHGAVASAPRVRSSRLMLLCLEVVSSEAFSARSRAPLEVVAPCAQVSIRAVASRAMLLASASAFNWLALTTGGSEPTSESEV